MFEVERKDFLLKNLKIFDDETISCLGPPYYFSYIFSLYYFSVA